jgi:hypothetical protein
MSLEASASSTFVRQKQTIVQQATPRIFTEEHSSYQKRVAVQQTVQRFQVLQEQHSHTTRNLTEKPSTRLEPLLRTCS